jgi:uncharacterized protein YqeY
MTVSLRDQFQSTLKDALKGGDKRRSATIRLIVSGLKDRDIAARGKGNPDGIDDAEILQMLQSMIKQRQESITMFVQGGREDLAQQEREEAAVIETFLPTQLSVAEVDQIITDVITNIGATSVKDMGKVMAELKTRYVGQIDFTKASAAVKDRLAGAA